MATKFQYIVRRHARLLGQGPIIGAYQDPVDFSASGDTILVTPPALRVVKIHKLFLVGAAASSIRFWSGPSTEGDFMSGTMVFSSNFAIALDEDDFTITTMPGKAFVISSSNPVQVGGMIAYSVI